MRYAKKAARLAIISLGWMVGLAVIAYLVVFVINLRDKPPSADAQLLQALSTDRVPVADNQNAYIYLLGFSIGRDQDPLEWGMRRATWAREAMGGPLDPDAVYEFPGRNHDLRTAEDTIIDKVVQRCRPMGRACTELLAQREADIQHWVTERRWILPRYLSLIGHTQWFESVPYDIQLPLPDYAHVMDAQLHFYLYLLGNRQKIYMATLKGMLEQDIRFWRMVLQSSDLLISKMIAVAAIDRHFSWSNLILARLDAEQSANAVPDAWRQPLSAEERSMQRCMVGEWIFSNSILAQIERDRGLPEFIDGVSSLLEGVSGFLALPLLQPQASSNRYAAQVVLMLEALDVPYNEYPQALAEISQSWRETRALQFPDVLYNPAGKWLFAIGDWDFTNYAARVADLEGVRRMALSVAELRSRAVPSQQVAGELPLMPRDPYTTEPFSWDESIIAVVFSGLEEGRRGRHVLLY